MRFNSEEERLTHPQARLIPPRDWQTYFNSELSDDTLSLMQASNEGIGAQIEALYQRLPHDAGPEQDSVWLAIAYSHSQLSAEALLGIGELLGLTKEALFQLAARCGRLDALRYLEEKVAPDSLQAMIASDDFWAFRDAAENEHFDVLRYLEEKIVPDGLPMMLTQAFGNAAYKGHLGILVYLEGKVAPDRLQAMIASDNFRAFGNAAYKGHLGILVYLEGKVAPERLQEMREAGDFSAFSNAARNGHLEVLRYLGEKAAPDKLQTIIASAFGLAALKGDTRVLSYLEGKVAPDRFKDIIASDDFEAFRGASGKGHLGVLRYLEDKVGADGLQAMIASHNFMAFTNAAGSGHLDVLRYLEDKVAPGRLQAMIGAGDFRAFSIAAGNGHLHVLRYLEDKVGADGLQAMIASDDFRAFCYAAEGGYLDVLHYLEGKVAPERLQEMREAGDFSAFSNAAVEEHTLVLHHLLNNPATFSYAERHEEEDFGDVVGSFLAEKIASLRTQKATLESGDPNAVFDVHDATESQLLFYMARHLIRLNEPAHHDNLLLLLSIPSVRALAHTEVTQGMSNELFRLAVSIGNTPAALLLLNIPAIRQLADQNDFYRAEVAQGLDVSVLAQDRESSMTALSQGEKERLQGAIARYQPMIKAAGVANIMNNLRTTLISRYKRSPATMLRANGETCPLPLEWAAYQALGLSANESVRAMQAYAQNKDHTAWRYLSKPNFWMHPQAAYVEVNAEHTQRWSTFESYQPLISMLYLGAIDAGSLPVDGYTLETRLAGFIDELALIGRAHNWDRTRLTVHGIPEEYDDFEPDRPSCYSGVKRRLFQSVKGHTLFAILTPEIIDAAIKEYVWRTVKKQVNDDNREVIKAILDKMIEEGESAEGEELAQLKTLDITPESQALFIQELVTRYGSQVTSFLRRVEEAFALQKGEAHVSKFYMTLERLFSELPLPTKRKRCSSDDAGQRFFTPGSGGGGGGGSKESEGGPSQAKRR
jgi:hypothetical protein